MAFDFRDFGSEYLDESFVEWLVDEQWVEIGSHFGRLWDYYHNQMFELNTVAGIDRHMDETGRNYVQAQEHGLPPRITGVVYSGVGGPGGGRRIDDIQRKEVVIENDITWRINAMVDFLFGKGIKFISRASDVVKRREIEKIIKSVFSANGDAGFFQDMAVLGSVYGFVDCLIRPGVELLRENHTSVGRDSSAADSSGSFHNSSSTSSSSFHSILKMVSTIGLELIEAP